MDTHWTKKLPTEPGWYWWRWDEEFEPVTVHVYTQRGGSVLYCQSRYHDCEPLNDADDNSPLRKRNAYGEWSNKAISERPADGPARDN